MQQVRKYYAGDDNEHSLTELNKIKQIDCMLLSASKTEHLIQFST